jgi:hypothetical protein
MLKQMIKAGIPALAITFLAACGNSGENKEAGAAVQEEQAVTAAPVKLKDEQVNNVYQHYVHLTTALINSDSAEAKVAGAAIAEGAKALPAGGTIVEHAQTIAAAPSLAVQREHYAVLSEDVIALVRATGLSSGELYVDYCPMANGDKGANWLSAVKDIRNPYFGDEMMTCGEVKETIK